MTGWWFSPGIPVFSTHKTDRNDVTEILLKVVLITINLNQTIIKNVILSLFIYLFLQDNKELQYSELSFNSSSGPRFIIHGKDKKNVYSDVDLSIRVNPFPSTGNDSDSDDNDEDFMYVDNIKKYTKKRSTRVKLNTK